MLLQRLHSTGAISLVLHTRIGYPHDFVSFWRDSSVVFLQASLFWYHRHRGKAEVLQSPAHSFSCFSSSFPPLLQASHSLGATSAVLTKATLLRQILVKTFASLSVSFLQFSLLLNEAHVVSFWNFLFPTHLASLFRRICSARVTHFFYLTTGSTGSSLGSDGSVGSSTGSSSLGSVGSSTGGSFGGSSVESSLMFVQNSGSGA